MGKEPAQITWFLKSVMVATGTWRLKLTQNKFTQTTYDMYSVLFQFSFLVFFFALLLNFPALLKKQDLQLIIEYFGYSIIVLLMVFKVAVSQTDKVRNLIHQCILEETRTYKEESEKLKDNFRENVKILNQVNLVPLLISAISVSAFCTAKYVEYTEYKDFNTTVDKPLAFPIWYPFNPNQYYGTAFIIAMYFGMLAVINNVGTQVLFFTLMTYAALQLKALKISAMEFHLYYEFHYSTVEFNEENNILSVLRKICTKHQSIISFVGELNIAMKNILLLEFFLNSLNIASVMVQIIIMTNTTQMIVLYILFFLLQVFQLFLMSWHANEIQMESISLSDALFQSKWYDQSQKAKRIISIMMLRSTKPLSLFIGPFYPMTNRTALSTLKAAYSYITMICAVAAKE